jgi:hypothetical protein
MNFPFRLFTFAYLGLFNFPLGVQRPIRALFEVNSNPAGFCLCCSLKAVDVNSHACLVFIITLSASKYAQITGFKWSFVFPRSKLRVTRADYGYSITIVDTIAHFNCHC